MPRPLRRTCSAQGEVRESRWSRVTSLGMRAMPSVIVALYFSISLCAVAEAADAQPRALAAAAAVRVPMLFTGAVAAGPPPPPQCDPGEFARGEAAARVDVAEMDANPKSVPAFHPRPREAGSDRRR